MQQVWEIMPEAGVYFVKIDRCETGAALLSRGDDGKEEPIRRRAGFLTNPKEIAKSLGLCRFWKREEDGPKLITSILEGLIRQTEIDAKRGQGGWNLDVMEIGVHVDDDAVDFDNPSAELEIVLRQDLGGHTDPVKVKAARRKDVDFVHEFGVHRKIPRASAAGGQFVTVKWIQVNTGEINSGHSTAAAT